MGATENNDRNNLLTLERLKFCRQTLGGEEAEANLLGNDRHTSGTDAYPEKVC